LSRLKTASDGAVEVSDRVEFKLQTLHPTQLTIVISEAIDKL